jgi:hypothetical protein
MSLLLGFIADDFTGGLRPAKARPSRGADPWLDD